MTEHIVNNPIAVRFEEPRSTNGLENGDWVKEIHLGNVDKSGDVLVVITEDSSGFYFLGFTPDAIGDWVIYVHKAGDSSVKTRIAVHVTDIESTILTEIGELETTLLAAVSSISAAIIAEVDQNEGKVDSANASLSTLLSNVSALPSASSIVAALLGETIESEGTITFKQLQQAMLAVLAGVTSDGGKVFQTPNGNAIRVSATINSSNERSAITLNFA